MPDSDSSVTEIIKTGWTLIVAPVFGWFAGKLGARRQIKRQKKAIIQDLVGLPMECKAILVQFLAQKAHTIRTDPGSPPMCVLIQRGIVDRGPGGGTYDAIDCYMSIRPDFWEVMDDWVFWDKSLTVFLKPPNQIDTKLPS